MSNIVKTISSELKNSRLFVKFFRYGKSDVQEVPQALPFGIDSNPIKGLQGLYIKTAQKGEAVLVGYVQKSIAELGELRLTSTDSDGVEQTYIYQKKDGTIELNGSSKNLTRFQDLETGFNKMKTDLNNFITAFNTHIHAGAGTPPTPVPSVIPVTPTTADISGAKIDNIKTN